MAKNSKKQLATCKKFVSCQLSFAIFFISLVPTATYAADFSLYDHLLFITQKELSIVSSGAKDTELQVKEFLGKLPGLDNATPAEVRNLLQEGTDLCERKGIDNYKVCEELRRGTNRLMEREMRIRTLGRDLQIIAASMEEPVMGGAGFGFVSRSLGALRLWNADVGQQATVGSGTSLQFQTAPASPPLQGAFEELGGALQALVRSNLEGMDDSAMVETVWRYRLGGYQWNTALDELDEDFADAAAWGMSPRRPEIEDLLQLIDERVREEEDMEEPAARQATLIRYPKELSDYLPTNVRVWTTWERGPANTLTSDTGLQWGQAVEPVLPNLCAGEWEVEDGACIPALAGVYPAPPPLDAASPLCSNAVTKSGYLCTAAPTDTVTCPEEGDPNAVDLIECAPPVREYETVPGGDVCADPQWHLNDDGFDPQTECRVHLECDDVPDIDAITSIKSPSGVTSLTVDNRPKLIPVHLILHELTHVKQMCGLPPGTNPYENIDIRTEDGQQQYVDLCCPQEGDAYRVQCEALAQDGVFGEFPVLSDGTPFNAETCTQILTDMSCRERAERRTGGACLWSFTYAKAYDPLAALTDEVIEKIRTWANSHNADTVSATFRCDKVIDTATGRPRADADPRIVAAIRDIEGMGARTCTPLQETEYRNTIGNNVCVLNRCLHQSLTEHRLIPGRSPLTAGETAYPFDVCMRDDPNLGAFGPSVSPSGEWEPPLYRPELLLQAIEETLCPGLPPGDALCTFDPNPRLDFPLATGFLFGGNLLDQSQEFLAPADAVRAMAGTVGIRIGNRLYNDLLQRRGGMLTDITRAASVALGQFTRTQFPSTMCPLWDADGSEFLNTNACGPLSSDIEE